MLNRRFDLWGPDPAVTSRAVEGAGTARDGDGAKIIATPKI
jgi:hypothetical protein